jgi:porphobilinogen synthase
MNHKFKRFRYRRIDENIRRQYRETFLTAKDFIWPVFLVSGYKIKKEIPSMPDVCHYSIDTLLPDLEKFFKFGLRSILLFGVPETKGIEQAYADDGLIQLAISLIRRAFPDLEIITDVCLCSYTPDGHCHIGDNDKTCEILAKIAVSHASAGVDFVAPSDMMDGRVYYIKRALRDHKRDKTGILSYASKFASNFYGPFRDAAECAPKSGNRKTYQMDYANVNEAMEEIATDIEEGADQIMIKPAMAYLDIVSKARSNFDIPIVVYNVSGEYKMLKKAVKNKWANEDIIWEVLISMKRAGTDRIVSYFAPEILKRL